MRLFHLVKQNHTVRTPAHLFCQRARLLVPDIARGRADKPCHGAGLHILAHVDAHKALRASIYDVRQRLAQLGLSHARRSCKEHGRRRALLVCHAASSPPDRAADRLHCRILPHDPFVQRLLELQKPLLFRPAECACRNACALRNDTSHVLARHQQHPLRAAGLCLSAYQLLQPVAKRRRMLIRAIAHRMLQLLRESALFFFQTRIYRAAGQPDGGCRLVEQINRLVRQKPVCQIPA